MDEQIVELQTRIAYQEHTLAELNDALAYQQQRILQLSEAFKRLAARMDDLAPAQPNEDAPPPHY